jgi:exodeoxyribonuclease VII large subunit
VPVRADLEATLASLGARLNACASRHLERKRQAVRAAARALPSPDQLLALPRRRFDEATSRLGRALTVSIERKRARLERQRLTPATLSRRLNETRRLTGRDIARARAAFVAIVRQSRTRFQRTSARLSPAPIVRRQRLQADMLAGLARRQDQAMARRLDRLRAALTQADRLLATLSHKAVLARGFALVKDADGSVVKSVAELAPGAALELEFADGKAEAIATSGGARPKLAAAKSPAKARAPGSQGSLF